MPYTAAEAIGIWNEFFRKTTQRHAPTTFVPLEESKEATSSSQLQTVALSPDDPQYAEFNLFIRNQRVQQSTNVIAINNLGRKIYNNIVNFTDILNPELPYLALALYTSKKISLQQCATLLEQHQTASQLVPFNIVLILDDHSRLTKKAKEILSIYRKQNLYMQVPIWTDEEESNFCQLVAALPPDQQVFYTYDYLNKRSEPLTELATHLTGLGLLHATEFERERAQLCILSIGAQDAVGLTLFGVEHYVCARPSLGAHSIESVEAAVNAGYRPGPLCFPGTEPFKDGLVHGFKRPHCEARKHDEYHARLYSKFPTNIREAFFLLRARLREFTLIDKSHDLWFFTDLESLWVRNTHPDFLAQAREDSAVATHIFCNVLKQTAAKEQLPRDPYSKDSGYFIMKDKSLSVIGAIFLINLILDYQKPAGEKSWRGVIDPRYLLRPFKEYYDNLLSAWDNVRSDSPHLMVFKSQIYFALKLERLAPKHINFMMALIDKHAPHLKIEFDKVSKDDAPLAKVRVKNTFCTVTFDRKLTNHKDFIWARNEFLQRFGLTSIWLGEVSPAKAPSTSSSCFSWFSCCWKSKPKTSSAIQSTTTATTTTAPARLFSTRSTSYAPSTAAAQTTRLETALAEAAAKTEAAAFVPSASSKIAPLVI